MNEQALKARLKPIANELDKNFNEVWKFLILERFLARLSRSEYSDRITKLTRCEKRYPQCRQTLLKQWRKIHNIPEQ